MIELQNVNLRLRAGGNVKKRNWYLILGMLLLVQLIAIFYFGSKKAGFHYDEYYSYYSSNVSIGLVPTDRFTICCCIRYARCFPEGSANGQELD